MSSLPVWLLGTVCTAILLIEAPYASRESIAVGSIRSEKKRTFLIPRSGGSKLQQEETIYAQHSIAR